MSKLVWIFDLDNTLHDARPHIFPHINKGMTAYLQQHLGLDEYAASELRMYYWKRYGATLSGMMKHHGTNAAHFLWHTHRFSELPRMVLREPLLRHVLKKLPGRKILFSNAPQVYAHRVLKLLRVSELFEGVFTIEHARFRPKPQMAAFVQLLREHRLSPACCVMVEDSVENLYTAKRLGMRTVWVDATPRSPAFVDVKVRNVMSLPRALSRLM